MTFPATGVLIGINKNPYSRSVYFQVVARNVVRDTPRISLAPLAILQRQVRPGHGSRLRPTEGDCLADGVLLPDERDVIALPEREVVIRELAVAVAADEREVTLVR